MIRANESFFEFESTKEDANVHIKCWLERKNEISKIQKISRSFLKGRELKSKEFLCFKIEENYKISKVFEPSALTDHPKKRTQRY